MKRLLPTLLLLLSAPVLAYEPGEAAVDVDAALTTFFAECAAGEDANTNVYDTVGSWTAGRVNDVTKTYHCLEAVDFEGHATATVTVSGRTYGFYDINLTGDEITCGTPGTFYETPGWELWADGYAGQGTNGSFAQTTRATLEKFRVQGDDNLIFCLEVTDPEDDGPGGPMLDLSEDGDNNVATHMYLHTSSAESPARLEKTADRNTIQYSVLVCDYAADTRRIAYTQIVREASATIEYNALTSSELFNCADAFQNLSVATPDLSTKAILGSYIENNDMYITDAMYVDCVTGAVDPDGKCACAENLGDYKIAVQDGDTPNEIDGTAWATGVTIVADDERIPITANGWLYIAQGGGTTDATTEPTWPTTWRSTINDNGIIWEAFQHRSTLRGNFMWGTRPARDPESVDNCPNLGSGASSAVSLHHEQADWVIIQDNITWDSQTGFWISTGNDINFLTISNNIFWDIGDKGCGETGCFAKGTINIGDGDQVEVYHNAIIESPDEWLINHDGGNLCNGCDFRANLIMLSGDGVLDEGTGTTTAFNAWISTVNTALIGTDEQLDVTLATRADSTAYSTGDLLIPVVTNGALYEVQGNCTSAGTPPTFTTDIDDDITDNDCTLRVIRAPLTIKTKRWTNPTDVTIPYAIGGSASSPLSALPGDVDQFCPTGEGISDEQLAGVTCP